LLPLLPITILWPLAPRDKGLEVELAEGVPSETLNDATDIILGDGSILGVNLLAAPRQQLKHYVSFQLPGHTKFSASCFYMKCTSKACYGMMPLSLRLSVDLEFSGVLTLLS